MRMLNVLDVHHMKEHAAYTTPLGEANGFIFRNNQEWIGVIIFHAGQSADLVERFNNLQSAMIWLDSYSCF